MCRNGQGIIAHDEGTTREGADGAEVSHKWKIAKNTTGGPWRPREACGGRNKGNIVVRKRAVGAIPRRLQARRRAERRREEEDERQGDAGALNKKPLGNLDESAEEEPESDDSGQKLSEGSEVLNPKQKKGWTNVLDAANKTGDGESKANDTAAGSGEPSPMKPAIPGARKNSQVVLGRKVDGGQLSSRQGFRTFTKLKREAKRAKMIEARGSTCQQRSPRSKDRRCETGSGSLLSCSRL